MHIRNRFKEIFPSVLIYLSLVSGALLCDYLLHLAGLVWVGRYFGIIGTVLIILSFLYSMKKRKMILWGSPKTLLQSHEVTAWIGALLILVHGGIHFNAIIPWLALTSMLIVVASGLTGKFLLKDAKERMNNRKLELQNSGLTESEIEQSLLSHSLIVDTMLQWRKVHMPLSMIFFAFASLHIVLTLLFWRWR